MPARKTINPGLTFAAPPGGALRRHHDPKCFTAHAGGPDRRRLWPFALDWPWHQALELAASDTAGPACKRPSRRPN